MSSFYSFIYFFGQEHWGLVIGRIQSQNPLFFSLCFDFLVTPVWHLKSVAFSHAWDHLNFNDARIRYDSGVWFFQSSCLTIPTLPAVPCWRRDHMVISAPRQIWTAPTAQLHLIQGWSKYRRWSLACPVRFALLWIWMGSIYEIEQGSKKRTYTALSKPARERQHKHAERSAVRCAGCRGDALEYGLHAPASSSWGPAVSWLLSILRTVCAVLIALLSMGMDEISSWPF